MNLIISERGTFLALRSERLRLQVPQQEAQEVALRDLQTVTVTTTACTLSAEAIRACAKFGVQIDLVDGLGAPYAKFSSPYLVGTVSTRRAQMQAYLTPTSVEVARHAIRARLRNQASLLKYFGKYRKEAAPFAFEAIQKALPGLTALETELDAVQGSCIDEVRDTLLGIEGRGGVVYWGAVATMLPDDLGFPGRLGRGATDPTNMTLNYGYGILYARAAGVLATAGLEPFAGFLHTDRPGKPSLVLDFVEGFRAACVDRPVLALLGRGWRPELDEHGKMTPNTRKRIAGAVNDRMDTRDSVGNKKFRLQNIMVMQARKLATFLRDEGDYPVYVASW
ncbi:CRISPR-associated endonuclease Cas1 1 [Deinococcus xinjiangensis]|uniref:CRISPR-associated endonuclease Cas1 n=1 Tax=Deinococcus xinjiangensis TaxID=457454 RepID=A0ABP9VES4_9DEIO